MRSMERCLEEGRSKPQSMNVTLYGIVAVGILYFWNWLNDLRPAFTAIGGDVITTTWTIVDVALLRRSAAMGVYMVKSDNQSGSHAGSTHSNTGATATHPSAVANYLFLARLTSSSGTC